MMRTASSGPITPSSDAGNGEGSSDRLSLLDKKVKSSLSLREIRDVIESALKVVSEIALTVKQHDESQKKLPKKDILSKCKSVTDSLDIAYQKMKVDVRAVSPVPSLGYAFDRNKTMSNRALSSQPKPWMLMSPHAAGAVRFCKRAKLTLNISS